MHTEINNNIQEVVSPPMPPAAVFDEQQVAAAKPVQPLPKRRWRTSLDRWQGGFNQRVYAVATMFAGAVICAAIATASVDWFSAAPPAQDDRAQSISESVPQAGTSQSAGGSLIKRPADTVREPREPRLRGFSNRRVVTPVPAFDDDEGDTAGKTRPRLVSVIH